MITLLKLLPPSAMVCEPDVPLKVRVLTPALNVPPVLVNPPAIVMSLALKIPPAWVKEERVRGVFWLIIPV
jgi:hypothetical protein